MKSRCVVYVKFKEQLSLNHTNAASNDSVDHANIFRTPETTSIDDTMQ